MESPLRTIPIVVILAGMAAALPTAAADRVKLSNGDRLTGELHEMADGQLRLQSELLGKVEIPLSAVSALSTEQEVFVTLDDARTVQGRVEWSGETLVVRTEQESLSVARAAVVSIRDAASHRKQLAAAQEPDPGFPLFRHWAGTLDGGLTTARGNNHTNQVNLGAEAARTTDRDRVSLYFTSLYFRSRADDVISTTANAIRSGLRYDRLIGERVFAFGFSDFEFDERQQLDLRSVFGGGLGWQLRRTERTTLDVFAGGSFNREKFSPVAAEPFARRSGEALGGQELVFRFSPGIQLTQRLMVFPNLTDPGEYRINFDVITTARLNSWLSWRIAVSDRFVSNPTGDALRNDLLLTTGIQLNFGKPRELPTRTRAPDLVPRSRR
jgi:putative salt-induced outer membrane protein